MALALLMTACHQPSDTPQLNDQNDTIAWALGENIALSLNEIQGMELDNDIVLQAIRHTLDGGAQPISDTIMRAALEYLTMEQQHRRLQQINRNKAQADKLQEAYFAQLKKDKPNIKQHPSGFYYEVLTPGKGPNAQYAQIIRFDYRSYFMLSGEPYDQTYGVRNPITHVVGKPMFSGLVDGVQLMNAGSVYRFYFPYQLAFGDSGKDGIPACTPLIYEVELHEIVSHK